MKKIDEKIDAKIDMTEDRRYYDRSIRTKNKKIINEIVNAHLPQIDSCHNKSLEETLFTQGYVKFDNFFTKEEAKDILKITENLPGYNAHVPIQSDGVGRIYGSDYNFNTCSYYSKEFLNKKMILDKIVDPKLLSLVQKYLGCFPSLQSFNCWWHKKTSEVYSTQQIHRDFDDYRFLCLFVYLTDIDMNNGPHVFYPRTHLGLNLNNPTPILGKAGTAILADTYALHHGAPLVNGERCLLWWRYCLHKNDTYKYAKYEETDRLSPENLFSQIEDNDHNRYLFRLFLDQK